MYTTPIAPRWRLFWVLLNILVECEVVNYPGVFNSLHVEGVVEHLNLFCKFIPSINTE